MWRQPSSVVGQVEHNRPIQLGHIQHANELAYVYACTPHSVTLYRALDDGNLLVSADFPLPPSMCPFWEDRAVERYAGPFNKALAKPILVVGNTVRSMSLVKRRAKIDIAALFSLTPLLPSRVQRT